MFNGDRKPAGYYDNCILKKNGGVEISKNRFGYNLVSVNAENSLFRKKITVSLSDFNGQITKFIFFRKWPHRGHWYKNVRSA